MKKSLTLFVLASLLSGPCIAQNWYVDGGISFIDFDDGTDSISPTNLYIRGGYQFNQYFNAGLESSVTISSDSLDYAPEVEFDVDTFTFYIRGGVPVSESVWLYGQIGRTNTELTAEYLGVEVSEDDNDTMFGFGAEIDVGSGNTYLSLNYSMYNNNDGVDVTGINLGVGARF